MLEQLSQERVLETEAPENLRVGVLLIRAHGIPPERRAWLKTMQVPVFDATCPDVARIQGTIRSHARRGFHTIIFGEPDHPEVRGLLGFAEGHGHVVLTERDVAQLPPDLTPVCLVSQSTQFSGKFEKIAAAVRARYPDAEVADTICASTRRRQQELLDLAREVDAIVVVGGLHSANTMHLVELARELRPALHIQTAAEIDPAWFCNYRRVALTAGASTPDFVIREVEQKLRSLDGKRA
jgi:4-hydroxy-3-methylbut-2-enyl diphosphate reductase